MKEIDLRQFEWPLIRLTLVITIFAFVLALILNFIVPEYDTRSSYVFGFGLIAAITMYYLFKMNIWYGFAKVVLISILWLTFNVSWYFNHGFTRSVIILFAFFFTFIVFILSNKWLIIATIGMVVNLGLLLLVESKWPDFIAGEWTEQQEKIDIIYTLLIGWVFIPGYVYLAKSSYINEYRNAKRSENLKASFIANMSHEIRTPLNAIMGFSEIIKDDRESRNNEMYYDIIHSNSIYLYDLVDQVLNISLLDSGNFKVNKSEVSTKNLLEQLEQEIQLQLNQEERKKEQVKLIVDKTDIKIVTDQVQLQQVLKNLSANAVKFTDSGRIEIGVRSESNCYHFYVKDTGQGIPHNEIESIFDRFVKLSDSKSEYSHRGAGLGLYISKKIIDQLGGEIGVKSKLGIGSEFWFHLPK